MKKEGSPRERPMITLGRLSKPHGVRGEMKLKPFFEEPIRDLAGETLTVEPDRTGVALRLKLEAVRGAGHTLIASFEGINTPEQAREITPAELKAPIDLMPELAEGEYYLEEIIGLPVFGPDGKRLGELVDVFPAGDRDVWTIRTPDGGEIMTPNIPETVKEVDLDRGVIVVELMEEME